MEVGASHKMGVIYNFWEHKGAGQMSIGVFQMWPEPQGCVKRSKTCIWSRKVLVLSLILSLFFALCFLNR